VMIITKAKREDIETILVIINEAKEWLRSQNVNQWQDGYPNIDSFLNDIDNDRLFVVKDNDRVIACFVIVNYEKTYDKIYEGSWSSDTPYIAVHRIAIKNEYKGKGVARFIFDELKKTNNHIRVDTHEDNLNMQKCLLNNGFEYRGIIYIERGQESDPKRLGYEYINE